MKTTIRTIIAMSLALFALSCNKELEQPKEEPSKEETTPSQELTSMTFTLAADEESKTALGDDGKSVHFNNGDEISLFDGTNNCKFTAKVLTDGSVSFLGEAKDIETAQYKALYPYREGASVNDGDGAVKGFCIPAEQTAVKGSFDPKANVSVAYAYEKDDVKYLRFVNVASLAKVVVPATDYKGSTVSYAKITIQGNNHYNEGTKAYDIPNDKVIADGDLSVITAKGKDGQKDTTNYTIPAEGAKVITLHGPITAGTYYIALYPAAFEEWQGFAIRAYDSKDNIVAFKNTYKANKFNVAKIKNLGTLNPTIPIPDPLDGVFSISKTKVVRFAPGNLQYQASTGNWKFAEEQYIAFGDKAEYGNQTPCLNKDGNEMGQYPTTNRDDLPTPAGGRVTQDKWIDLYCFGCTGDATITKMARGYMPWETWVGDGLTETVDHKTYYYGGKELTIASHTDWGYVVTGTEENPWFTMSVDEWRYLLGADDAEICDGKSNDRQKQGRFKDGITDKTCLYIRINVGGERDGDAATGTWNGGKFITGTLLLPDHFEWPAAAGREPVEYYNVPWQKSIDKNGEYKSGATAYSYIVAPNATRTDAAYSELEYKYLESVGCVFLPTTGFRHSAGANESTFVRYTFAGNVIKSAELLGCYWTRNLELDSYADALGFWPNGGAKTSSGDARPPRAGKHYMTDATANYRHQGYAVRLVKSYDKPMSGSINNLKEKDTTDNHFFDED